MSPGSISNDRANAPTLSAAVAKLEREKLTQPFAIFVSIDDDALEALVEDFETQKSVVLSAMCEVR